MRMNDVASVLKMNDLYVRRCSFERIPGEFTDFELQLSVDKEIEERDDGTYEVILQMRLTNEPGEFTLQATMAGNFEVNAPTEKVKREVIEKNTVSIMFPYLRSQITLLSSQPGMKPIVLPPININALIDSMEDEGQAE